MRRLLLMCLAVLVATFVAFYPYLSGVGICVSGGCPEISQPTHAAHAGFSTLSQLAMLATSVAVVGALGSFRRRRTADRQYPFETYLSPDTPPPRFLSSRY